MKEIPSGRSEGHFSCLIDLKICQNVCLDILDDFNLGHLRLKTRVLGQIKGIPCGHSEGLISC